jgi:hypothetical protein
MQSIYLFSVGTQTFQSIIIIFVCVLALLKVYCFYKLRYIFALIFEEFIGPVMCVGGVLL